MLLNFEQIKKITVGAVDIWQEQDGVHFAKCTKEQLTEWNNIRDELFINASATTGVRLDFYTDSPFINVGFSSEGRYEVIENGVLVKQIVITDKGENHDFCIKATNECALNRFIITMPSHFDKGVVKYIEVQDNATINPHEYDIKILFLGDSITQGYNSDFDSMAYAYQVSDFFNAESVIQGVGGACFSAQTVSKTSFEPDLIFVAYGTNDFGTYSDITTLVENQSKFFNQLIAIYPNTKIYYISPIWRKDYDTPKPMGKFSDACKIMKEVARLFGVTVIDGEKMIPPFEKFMADDLHPNDLGFSIYARNLVKEVIRLNSKK